MKYHDLPPFAPALMESTRAIGYSTEAAIADIIDNSVTAKATKIDIDFFPMGTPYVYILDNGKGMDGNKLISAMQYGSSSPLDTRDDYDLGRYGLGMKTASTSQCKRLTVVSKQGESVVAACWDINYIREKKEWSLIIFDDEEIDTIKGIDKLKAYESGTLVLWEDLDRFSVGEFDVDTAFSNKMNMVREHVALVFHRYLSGEQGIKKIIISMNGVPIVPADPFLANKSTQLMDEEEIKIRGEKVLVTPYILPHVSNLTAEELKALGGKDGLRRQQGFYVYRNKRLIVWGDWFRLMRKGDLSKLARVKVDIPNSLDDLWTLDIKKSSAVPPEEVRSNLKLIVQKITDGSKKTWTYRGKKETSDKVVHLWHRMISRDNSVYYEVNKEHPMVKQIIDKNPELNKSIDILLKQISFSLPLNSLYIDLTNDEKLVADTDSMAEDVLTMFKSILETASDVDSRNILIESLKNTEPFNAYVIEINELIEKELAE